MKVIHILQVALSALVLVTGCGVSNQSSTTEAADSTQEAGVQGYKIQCDTSDFFVERGSTVDASEANNPMEVISAKIRQSGSEWKNIQYQVLESQPKPAIFTIDGEVGDQNTEIRIEFSGFDSGFGFVVESKIYQEGVQGIAITAKDGSERMKIGTGLRPNTAGFVVELVDGQLAKIDCKIQK